MKKIFLLFCGLVFSLALFAQTTQDDGTVQVVYPTEFKITKPLIDLINENPVIEDDENAVKPEAADRVARIPYMYVNNPNALPKENEDPAMQRVMGTKQMLTPIVSWIGLAGNGTPPDPTGAAGPNHYMQAVNSQYKIYSKTGTSLSTTANLGALLFNINDGDPIVLYDKFADRWFISEFDLTNYPSGPYYSCIAVSQTNDPTGLYYSWKFNIGNTMPDYLKFSIWQDGYYMTANWGSTGVVVYERNVMLTGGASPRMLKKTQSFPNNGGFFCPLPGDADGQLPPAGTPCPIFSYTDDGWGGSYTDAIKVYEMAVNWVPTTPTATITNVATLATLAFDASYNSSWNDISQPSPSTQKLDGIGGVFTFRAQNRCWTGYNSVVLNIGVKISSTQRSIRWYELRRTTAGAWSIYQQGTYTPDSYSRWCGSIAMDDNGSIGLAYNISGSTTVYPGIRYTGRNASDPLGTMTYAEQLAIAGTSSQAGTNRWGDYSHLSLDPSNGTILWHTAEYYASGQKTRIYSFSIPVPTGIESAQQETGISVYQSGEQLMVKAEKLPSSNEMSVDLFNINGQKIDGQIITAIDNRIETSFNIQNLAAGTYLVRIGENNTSFQKVTKVVIQ
jgi:hypothetical protein